MALVRSIYLENRVTTTDKGRRINEDIIKRTSSNESRRNWPMFKAETREGGHYTYALGAANGSMKTAGSSGLHKLELRETVLICSAL